MLNTRNEENNTVFYSYLACFVNTSTLNTCVFMSYTGLTSGIRYSFSYGCATEIRKYLFNT